MTNHLRTITEMVIHTPSQSPVFGEGITTIRLESQGAGNYIVIEQNDDSDESNGKVSLTLEEIHEMLACAKQMLAQEGAKE